MAEINSNSSAHLDHRNGNVTGSTKLADAATNGNAEISQQVRNLVLRLFEINAIKVGHFKLKSGQISPIYIDLRVIVSYPEVMIEIAEMFWSKIVSQGIQFDVLCGVPYTALPLATGIAIAHKKPMVMRRKEAKNYGTRQMVEGNFSQGEVALVIEDVITSGTSVMDTANVLRASGLLVRDAVILLGRNQNGADNLAEHDIKTHCLFNLLQVSRILCDEGKLSEEQYTQVCSWLHSNPSVIEPETLNDLELATKKDRLPFKKRSELAEHPLTKKLFGIIDSKRSNLCLSADLANANGILELTDKVGPYICMLKLHVDIIDDFSYETLIKPLTELAEKHQFLIFEDRKFADIGSTVAKQYASGVYKIRDWAHLVNAHLAPGPGVITGLKSVAGDLSNRGCLLIAQMSSEGSINTKSYVQSAYLNAIKHRDFVIGFICQSRLTSDPQFVHFTPGVSLSQQEDSLGQVYNSPENAIKRGADVLIVGRAIYEASDPVAQAVRFQTEGWTAYNNNLVQQ